MEHPYKNRDYLTTRQVAELMDVHVGSVRRWTREGTLTAYRTIEGGKLYFKRADVEAMFRPVER